MTIEEKVIIAGKGFKQLRNNGKYYNDFLMCIGKSKFHLMSESLLDKAITYLTRKGFIEKSNLLIDNLDLSDSEKIPL